MDAEVTFAPMQTLGIERKYLEGTTTRSLKDVIDSYTYFANGDVLMAKITPCFENGKLGIASDLVNGMGFGSSEFIVMRPRETLSAGFLYYFLARDSFRDLGKKGMTGTAGQKRLTRAFLENFPISIPPISEQDRIVAILDQAFEAMGQLSLTANAQISALRSLFDNYLATRFAFLSEHFPCNELADVSTFENGDRGTNYPSKACRISEGIPFINAGHLVDNVVDFREMDYIPRERFDLLSNGKIRSGDILFCLRGSLGKFASVQNLREGAIASSLIIIRPKAEILDTYLLSYFKSSLCAQMIRAHQGGTAQPNLSAKNLGRFLIPVPGLKLQQSISDEVDLFYKECLALAGVYRNKLLSLQQLRQTLLHAAFSGNL